MSNTFNQGADQGTNTNGQAAQGTSFSPDQGNTNEGNPVSQEDLARLLKRDQHAQDHIKTLEEENKQYRDKLEELSSKVERLGNVDEIMEKLDSFPGESTFDENEIVTKVTESVQTSMKQQAIQEKQQTNFSSVSEALTEAFGDKTDEMVRKACEEHGMSWDDMVDLAKRAPKATLSLFKLKDNKPDSNRATYNSSINSQAFLNNQGTQEPNKADVDYINKRSSDITKSYLERLEAHLKG